MSLTPKLPNSDESMAGSLDLLMEQQEAASFESRKASPAGRKKPPLALPVLKSSSQTIIPFPRSPSFLSPMKSPSQYFQICY